MLSVSVFTRPSLLSCSRDFDQLLIRHLLPVVITVINWDTFRPRWRLSSNAGCRCLQAVCLPNSSLASLQVPKNRSGSLSHGVQRTRPGNPNCSPGDLAAAHYSRCVARLRNVTYVLLWIKASAKPQSDTSLQTPDGCTK